jgi:hypothetical protein
MGWSEPQSLGGVLNTGFSPNAVSWGPGRLDVFAVGLDLQLLHWWYDERLIIRRGWSRWSGPEQLGGALASNPTAVSLGPGLLDIFWIDASTGQLAHISYDGGWSAPQLLGGNLLPQFYAVDFPANPTPFPASVSAVSMGPGLLDVFASYSDYTVAHWWLNNNGWTGPENLASAIEIGEVISPPSAVSWGPGRIDVFVNAQSALAHWWLDTTSSESGWNGPEAAPADVITDLNWQGPPCAVSWAPGRLDIFFQGWPEGASASQLMHFWYDNGWNGPVARGGFMVSAPGAVSWGPGRLDVVSAEATPGGFLQHWWWDNGPAGSAGGWGGPESIYGFFTNRPCAVSFTSGRLDIFGIDADSYQLDHWQWN